MSFVSSYLSCPIEWDYVIQSKKLYLIPLVSSWLHPISFLPIISHLPSSSLVIQTASSFSYRCPLWITTPGPFFMETYWLFWWSHATAKIFPPFLFKWQSLWGGPECGSMCKSQQSLPSCTCVKQCVVGRLHCSRKPSLSFFFFLACQDCRMHGENRSLHFGWWQGPQHPAFGLKIAGIQRDEPDGRYLGQWALKPNRHDMHFTMKSEISQSDTTF